MPAHDLSVAGTPQAAHEQSLLVREERRAAAGRRHEMLRIVTLRALVLAGLMAFWWTASGTLIDKLFVSDPISVAISLYRITLDGSLWWHLELTLYEMVLGYILAVVVGIGLAIASSQIP